MRYTRVGAVVGVGLLVASCATDLPVSVERAERVLPPDASVYLAARSEHLQALIGDVVRAFELDADEVDDIIGDSERLVASVGSEGNGGALTAAASGSYPGGRIRFGLTLSRAWRRTTVETEVSSRPYFQERDGLGQLAVPSNRLVLFANGGMEDTVRRAATDSSANDAVSLDPDAELSVLLPGIGDRIRSLLPRRAQNVPLEHIEVNVRYDENNVPLPFEVYGRIGLADERGARVFSVIARLVIGNLAEGVPLSALSVERSGETISFSGLPADEQRLREWISGFLDGLTT
ncbi:MAG: hypothetical protein ACOCRN_00720 [Spirochaetia bacterium]